MTINSHSQQFPLPPALFAGLLLCAVPAHLWAGGRLTSCGFMAASAA